jgi:hypothetical protein
LSKLNERESAASPINDAQDSAYALYERIICNAPVAYVTAYIRSKKLEVSVKVRGMWSMRLAGIERTNRDSVKKYGFTSVPEKKLISVKL